MAFGDPSPAPGQSTQGGNQFAPIVRNSLFNGVSPNLRDLPVAEPVHGPPYVINPIMAIRPLPLAPIQAVPDPVHQRNLPPLAMPTPIQTFEGMNQAEGCGNCIPPDPNGAVGPNHFAEMVNSSFAIYSKTGTRLTGPTHINALWAGLPGPCKNDNDGDPVVVYDHMADRWVLSQFAVNGGNGPYDECIAVSTTSDPTGSYYVYDFHLSDTVFHDYPKLGTWPDAYYMTTNQFAGAAQTFAGAGAFAFERDRMLLGQSARMLFADLSTVNSSFGGMLPSHLDGPAPPAGAPNYFAEVDSVVNSPSLGPDAMRLWKFHVDWSNTANSTFGLDGQPNFVLPVASWNPAQCVESQGTCVPQMGSTTQLDVIGDRIMFRLAYRNFGDHESLLINHSVVADARIGVRWYEVRNLSSTPTIYQQSTFAPIDTLYRWMGSIAMDGSGNIAIGYSTSSATTFPSISYAGRLANDPLNQLTQGEAQMFAGLGPENVQFFVPPVGRWGDYTDLTIDPTDSCTFWYVNEYFPQQTIPDPTAPWRTRFGKFKFPQCVAIAPSPTPTSTVIPSPTPTPTSTVAPTATATGTPAGTTTPSGTPTPPPACLNSSTLVVTDPSGDQGVGNPAASDALSVSAYEDYTYINSERLVFALKVNSNLATIPANQIWNVVWTFNGTTYYVAMKSDDNSDVSYEYGTIANSMVTTLGVLDAGSYDNQGNITMAIAGSSVGSPAVGAVLTAVNGDTQLNIGGILFSDEDTTSNGTYTVRAKNGACSPIPLPTPGSATYIHGGMSFSANYTTRAPYIGQDVEPSVRCDKFGNCYVAAIRGVPGGTDLWYFDLRPTVNGLPNPNYDPFMRNPQYRGQPDHIAPVPCVNDPMPCTGTVGGDGGGDVDIAVGFNSEATETTPPTLAYSSLVIGNISTQRSMDRGATFIPNPGGNVTGGIPVDDRQWLEFFGPNTVYLFYRTLEPAISQIQRSTDGGLTYGPAATAGAVGQAGAIAVDQNDGTVYISGSNGSVSVGIPPAAGLPPITYTTHDVAGNGNSHLFFLVKVAADGTAYACYSDDHNVFVRYSTDKGNTWSSAIRVSDGPETQTAVFPGLTTGPVPGTIGVVWYGSDHLSTLDDTANWHVFYSLGTNVKGATPTFRQVEASDHVIHGANISENGFDPTGNNPPNRNLADYFQVAFDPTGAAVIGYCDDHNDLSGHTFVTRQISGPGATGAGIPTPVEGSALPPPPNEPLPRAIDVGGIPGSQVTDQKDDVRLGGNPELGGTAVLGVDDPLDIVSVLYSAEPTSDVNPAPLLTVKMKVSDMTAIPPSSNWRMTFTANAPNSILSPTYEYSFGLSDRGDGFFVQAITDVSGAQSFVYGTAQRLYSGAITYTNVGAADCGFFDQTAKTVTIKVALSKLNAALPAGHTQIAPGSTLVGLRASAFTTAGSGATGSNKADTTRGGTQFLIAVGPLTPCGPAAPSPTPSTSPGGTPTPTATGSPIGTVTISGNVSYCSNPSANPVPGVSLTLTGTSSASTTSNSSGNYQFSNLMAGGSYTVTPSKAGLVAGSTGTAINTVDVIAVQRHFLISGTPLSGCRLTAADVNGDSAVNTVDAVAVQRFYLGFTTGTANVGKFQFSPTNRTYLAVINNQTGQNYGTLIFGDVASGFVYGPQGEGGEGANKAEMGAPVGEITLPNVGLYDSKTNHTAEIKTSVISAASNIVGFFDSRTVTFQDSPIQKAGLTAGNWNVTGNVLPGDGPIRRLRVSAFSNDFIPLSGSGPLFELRLAGNGKGAQLNWAPAPDQFIFIDRDLKTHEAAR